MRILPRRKASDLGCLTTLLQTANVLGVSSTAQQDRAGQQTGCTTADHSVIVSRVSLTEHASDSVSLLAQPGRWAEG